MNFEVFAFFLCTFWRISHPSLYLFLLNLIYYTIVSHQKKKYICIYLFHFIFGLSWMITRLIYLKGSSHSSLYHSIWYMPWLSLFVNLQLISMYAWSAPACNSCWLPIVNLICGSICWTKDLHFGLARNIDFLNSKLQSWWILFSFNKNATLILSFLFLHKVFSFKQGHFSVQRSGFPMVYAG